MIREEVYSQEFDYCSMEQSISDFITMFLFEEISCEEIIRNIFELQLQINTSGLYDYKAVVLNANSFHDYMAMPYSVYRFYLSEKRKIDRELRKSQQKNAEQSSDSVLSGS